MLRIYIGIAIFILTGVPFILLGIAQYQSYQNHKKIKEVIERLDKAKDEKILMPSPPPLPVCGKGIKNNNCRQLSADETGSTVRGVRDEEIKQD
jgi:hypothetical protein